MGELKSDRASLGDQRIRVLSEDLMLSSTTFISWLYMEGIETLVARCDFIHNCESWQSLGNR